MSSSMQSRESNVNLNVGRVGAWRRCSRSGLVLIVRGHVRVRSTVGPSECEESRDANCGLWKYSCCCGGVKLREPALIATNAGNV